MTNIKSEEINQLLGEIIDPDLNLTLKELGSIDRIEFDGSDLKIYLKLIQPIYWVAEKLNKLINDNIVSKYPDIVFEVLISEVAQDVSNRAILPGVKNIIAISSGKGGVGKSSLASNIAVSLAKSGAKVGILDADVYGPSQPTMFGLAGRQMGAVRTPEGATMGSPIEAHGVKVGSMGFVMEQSQAAIVRGPMLAGYFSMLFEQIWWGNLDFLILDLPPGTGDIQLTMVQRLPLSGAVVITTPQEISLSDVRRSIKMFEKVNVDVLGIVENMSWFETEELPQKKFYIFGEGGGERVAKETGTDLLGQVPLDTAIRENGDGGTPIVVAKAQSPVSQKINELTSKIVSKVRKKNLQIAQNPSIEINI